MVTRASATRGEPSWVWQAGQDRRLRRITAYANLDGAWLLDVGCGVGAYSERLAALGARAVGTEIEWPRARQAHQRGLAIVVAAGEAMPFADGSFATILLHEVLEHVADDRATMGEVARLLSAGGRAVIFVPNRWWPFETHGVQWRGRYRFGNAPFVNYLPDGLRNRLAPHVRVYTRRSLHAVLDGLPLQSVVHTHLFPGYDKIVARRPGLGRALRRLSHGLEATPLHRFGLSHLLVVEKTAPPATGAVPGPRPKQTGGRARVTTRDHRRAG